MAELIRSFRYTVRRQWDRAKLFFFFSSSNEALNSFISPYYICVTSLSAACYVCASTESNDGRVAITLLSKWTRCLNQSPSPYLRHLCCYSPTLPINVWLWWLPPDLSVTQSVPCEGNNPPPPPKCFAYVYVRMRMCMCTCACINARPRDQSLWARSFLNQNLVPIFAVKWLWYVAVVRVFFFFFEGFYNVKCLFSVKYTRIVASWCYGCVKCAGPFIWLVVCNVTLANYVFYDVELGCMRRNRRTRNQQVFLNAQNVAWLVFTLPFCALSNFLTCYHILWKRSSYIFVYYYILLNENIYVYYCSCDGCVLRLRDGLAKRKSLM